MCVLHMLCTCRARTVHMYVFCVTPALRHARAVPDLKVLWRTYRRSWLTVDVVAAMPWWLSGLQELKLLQVCTHTNP